MSELAWDLNVRNVTKIRTDIRQLEEAGWILRKESASREYFLVQDPMKVLRAIHSRGELPAEREEAIDEILDMLKLPLLDDENESIEGAEHVPNSGNGTEVLTSDELKQLVGLAS